MKCLVCSRLGVRRDGLVRPVVLPGRRVHRRVRPRAARGAAAALRPRMRQAARPLCPPCPHHPTRTAQRRAQAERETYRITLSYRELQPIILLFSTYRDPYILDPYVHLWYM